MNTGMKRAVISVLCCWVLAAMLFATAVFLGPSGLAIVAMALLFIAVSGLVGFIAYSTYW